MNLLQLRDRANTQFGEVTGQYDYIPALTWDGWINEGFQQLAVDSEFLERRADHDIFAGTSTYGPWSYSITIFRAEIKTLASTYPASFKPVVLKEAINSVDTVIHIESDDWIDVDLLRLLNFISSGGMIYLESEIVTLTRYEVLMPGGIILIVTRGALGTIAGSHAEGTTAILSDPNAATFRKIDLITIGQLDRIDPNWQGASGDPTHWFLTDMDLMTLYPKPVSSVWRGLRIYHRGLIVSLATDTSVCLEFPAWAHMYAADYAIKKALERDKQFSQAQLYDARFREGVYKLATRSTRQKFPPGFTVPTLEEL